jgi:hypothetical protein
MSEISVFSRAHRTLRDTPRFFFASKAPEVAAPYLEHGPAGESLGEAVGVYLNPPAEQPSAIVVTENGLLAIRSGAKQWIKFSELRSIRAPNAENGDPEIRLTLKSGIVVSLKVAGADDRFRDVYSFIRFLDRVLEDRERV